MIKGDVFAVGTTAVDLTANVDVDGEYMLHIQADISSALFYIGGSGLAGDAGWPVASGTESVFRLQAGTRVYGICNTGAKTVRILAYSV